MNYDKIPFKGTVFFRVVYDLPWFPTIRRYSALWDPSSECYRLDSVLSLKPEILITLFKKMAGTPSYG